ncbi:MAG: hypothetical protein ACU0C9_13005 [Paracoccaceae bacterium]
MLDVTGLAADQDDAVTINYDTDTVTLELGEAGAGSGVATIETLGDEDGFVT